MSFFLALSKVIDAINTALGKASIWLILLAVVVSALNATSRYALGMASNAWLELQWYLYGTVFLIASSYTLLKNEHVRIDFVSNMLTKRQRDWVDLFGHTFFLLPFTVLMVTLSFPWVMKSISYCGDFQTPLDFLLNGTELVVSTSCERSQNSGGLLLWPAKIMILIGFSLLTAQAISEIIKRAAILMGKIEDPNQTEELSPPAEDMDATVNNEVPSAKQGDIS